MRGARGSDPTGAHGREAVLVGDQAPDEVEQLAELLRRVLKRVPDITGLPSS